MKVIAEKVRRHYSNPALEYIRPVYLYNDETNSFVKAEPNDFPNNGEIFVIGGYDYLVEEPFEEYDFFRVNKVEINEKNYIPTNTESCSYYTYANTVEKLSSLEFLAIYNGTFNINNRTIDRFRSELPWFIRDQEYLYGPFSSDYTNEVWTSITSSSFDETDKVESKKVNDFIKLFEDCVFKYRIKDVASLILEPTTSDNDGYVTSFLSIIDKDPLEIFYIGSKEKTLIWGKNFLKSQLSEQEANVLSKVQDMQLPDLKSTIERQKFEYFKQFVTETNEWTNVEFPKFLEQYLKSSKGISERDAYLKNNEDAFFKNYRRNELEELDKQISQKKNQLEELKVEENNLKIEQETKENKVFEGLSEDEIDVLKNFLKDTEARRKIIEFQNYDEITKAANREEGILNYLRLQKAKLEDEKKDLEGKHAKLIASFDQVKKEVFKDELFVQKLIDAKIYTDVLNNINPRSNISLNDADYHTVKITTKVYNKELTSTDFINKVQERLKSLNRNITFEDTANYLVSIHQSFLTVFAGLPGIGKTSLVEKLAKALGCYDNGRYLSIAVQKGWTSSKDLLGYYNPLLQKYQPAKTGLYTFIKQVEKDNGHSFLNLVLLDEANLSPMEHYWSDFSSRADEDYVKEISVTEDEKIAFGDNLKFIATINYDHTTEVLSDRLISRTPIIKLSNSDFSFDEEIIIENEPFEIFSAAKISEWLKPNRDNFKGDIKKRFESIVKVLADDNDTSLGQPIIVSIRKQKAVEAYCNVAGTFMRKSNQFDALDYAINQNVLPLINGRGDAYKERLKKLQERLQGLALSSKHLDKIIKAGDLNFKHYKFFY